MTYRFLSAASALLVLAACQSTPSSPSERSIPAGSWGAIQGGGMLFVDNGGVCPDNLGIFSRYENSTLEVTDRNGAPRHDGVCSYRADEIGGVITSYFYITEGQDQQTELLNVVRAISSRQTVTPLEGESNECSLMISIVSGGGNVTVSDELSCVVMEIPATGAITYAALTEDGGYFAKIRATTRANTAEATSLTNAAIGEFYAAQR